MNDIEKRAREQLAEGLRAAFPDDIARRQVIRQLLADELDYISARVAVKVLAAALTPRWQPIETAPKSAADGRGVEGVYVLGFIPDSELVDPQTCIDVVWWEPLLVNSRGGRGRWQSTRHGDEVSPTHWMPLPAAPEEVL